MGQPVMDTLRLSQKLRETGVESGQAEGMAQALGTELDEHVAVRQDLDAGFDRVQSEIQLTCSNLEAQIKGVRSDLESQIKGVRTDLEAQIQGVRSEIALMRSEFNTKFNWGFGLMVAFLSVLVGMGWIDLNKPTPTPTAIQYVPLVVPGTVVPQPAPNPAAPATHGVADTGTPPAAPR